MVTGNPYPVIDYISVVVLNGCSHTLSRLCPLFNSSAHVLKSRRIIFAVEKDPPSLSVGGPSLRDLFLLSQEAFGNFWK